MYKYHDTYRTAHQITRLEVLARQAGHCYTNIVVSSDGNRPRVVD